MSLSIAASSGLSEPVPCTWCTGAADSVIPYDVRVKGAILTEERRRGAHLLSLGITEPVDL